MNLDNESKELKIKPVEELTFSDDFMFGAVMRDAEICKGVLERLLRMRISRISYPERQKSLDLTYTGKGVRLDVYAETPERIFDVECQAYREKPIGRRARYYQSMLDADSLLKGADYSELKESYVLFICLSDPFGRGLPVYTFERRCREDRSVELDDASRHIMFNSAAWRKEHDSELRAFLAFVQGNGAGSDFTRRLSSMVNEKKFEKTFINDYMAWSLHDRDVRKRGIEEGIAQQKAEDEKLIAQKDVEIERLKKALLDKQRSL